MIDRRAFIGSLTGGLLAAPLAAEAQQAEKVWRIGFLNPGSPPANPAIKSPIRQGLDDLGYVEGRNVVIEYRYAEGKAERLPALAAELVALKVDVIWAGSTIGARAAKQATGTLPIVFVAGDPVESGLVTSLAHPGGNATGLASNDNPDIVGKRLEQLKQAVPGVNRVAVLWQPGGTHKNLLQGTEVAAQALGIVFNSLRREVRRTSTGPSRT